jgi:hypothetical protein
VLLPNHGSGVLIIPCHVPRGQGYRGKYESSGSDIRKRAIERSPVKKCKLGQPRRYGPKSAPEPVEPRAPLLSRTRVSDWDSA